MYEPDVLMHPETIPMVEDAVAEYRRYLTALTALFVLDWSEISAKFGLRREGDNEVLLEELRRLRGDSSYFSKFSRWFDDHFPGFPTYFPEGGYRSRSNLCKAAQSR